MERKGVSVDNDYPHVYLLNNSFSFKKMGEKKKKIPIQQFVVSYLNAIVVVVILTQWDFFLVFTKAIHIWYLPLWTLNHIQLLIFCSVTRHWNMFGWDSPLSAMGVEVNLCSSAMGSRLECSFPLRLLQWKTTVQSGCIFSPKKVKGSGKLTHLCGLAAWDAVFSDQQTYRREIQI